MPTNCDQLERAARAYHDNHHWVPLRLAGKKPVGARWQKRTWADPIPTFVDGDNIGILLGKPSGNLARLDPDFAAIPIVTEVLFPEPTAIAGRASATASVRLYLCDDIKSKDFNLPSTMKDDTRLPHHDGERSVKVYQILSTGKQTMVPPSVHPESGEAVSWGGTTEQPATITKEELIKRCGIEAFLLAVRQFWPGRGTRNEAAMALARVLLEVFATRIPDDEERITIVDDLVVAVAMAGGDGEDSRDGKTRANATLEKMLAGEETVGMGRLLELLELPPEAGKTFRKWLGLVGTTLLQQAGLPWREWTRWGPAASLHNARQAIEVVGVECRYDLFHDKILIGFRGDEIQHQVRELIGEFTDNALVRLRQIVSERFGFDPTDSYIRDAIKTLALENCFDPVLELLEQAQREWDGTKRLDDWVVTYLGCVDTKLNRAIGRKTLVAAVRRARVPGCKYDTITVLEGPEGILKSTAIRIIAGDENFSDQSLLGARDKEVQEQLGGIWMHENADLAGMKRAEVEHVKAFASRQVDRARPAYGRVREDRKRRSIEWATTNNEEYLQSQTGNRRFWPLKVGTIDITALGRERLQLLGEAANYEAAGESVVLDDGLWEAAVAAQEQRRVRDPWEDVLVDIPVTVPIFSREDDEVVGQLTIVHRIAGEERVSSRDLLEHVLKIPPARQQQRDAMRLSTVMRLIGWTRPDNGKVTIDAKRVRGYWREEVL